MKPFSAKILLLSALGPLVFGCAKKQSDIPAVQEKQTVLVGSLTENLSKVLNDESRDDCDNKQRESKLELVSALDAKKVEIENFTKNNVGITAFSNYRRVQLGPTTVREPLGALSPKIGWQSFSSSWKEALADFSFLKSKPANSGWVMLNSTVRSLVLEDVNRVVYYQNPFLDKDDGPNLELLVTVIQNCQNTPNCDEISIPQSLEYFISIQPNYRTYQRSIRSKTSFSEKRRVISRFLRYVQNDFSIYKFHVNPKMVRIGASKYELSADPGPFAQVTGQLRGYIENEWKSPIAQVFIHWKDSAADADLFRILLGDISGERSYVSRADKIVMLYPDVRSKSIAHEFGHVMGFTDRYYYIWHPEICEYRVRNREDDIMSDPSSGSVLQEHWDELSRHY